MYFLTFTSYSRNCGILPGSNYALLLQSVQYAELVNCSFHDNIGTALVVIDTNIILAGSSDFTHNRCESTSCVGGGGIVALSSNVTFTGNTTFLENFATLCGGGIYTSNHSAFSFSGIITFIKHIIFCTVPFSFAQFLIFYAKSLAKCKKLSKNFVNI